MYMGFKGLAWIVFAVVLVQFFLAGIGVFGEETMDDSAFNPHRLAGLLLVPASLLLLILAGVSAFTGGVRGQAAGMAALLFVLMIVQAILVIAFYESAPIIAALHPVNALILLGLSFSLARIARTRPAGEAAPSRVR
jgi:heme A synthase